MIINLHLKHSSMGGVIENTMIIEPIAKLSPDIVIEA